MEMIRKPQKLTEDEEWLRQREHYLQNSRHLSAEFAAMKQRRDGEVIDRRKLQWWWW